MLYLSGYQRKQIARLLEVSPNTIRNHIQEIYDALGISNKIEALRWALAQPIIAEQLLNPSSEGPGYHSATEPGGAGSTSATMEGAVGEAIAYFQRQVIESPMVVPQW